MEKKTKKNITHEKTLMEKHNTRKNINGKKKHNTRKNILHIRAIHASTKVPQSPVLQLFIMYALGMQTVLYELEM